MVAAGVVVVVGVGAFYINTTNWHPFIPSLVHDATATGGTRYGMDGVPLIIDFVERDGRSRGSRARAA